MTSAPASIDRHFWLLTLAALAGMLVTASLGRWQLSRAAEKQALQALIEARGRMPAIDARTLLAGATGPAAAAQALVHRAVVLQGRWRPEHTVYLDNRQMQGQVGFFVVTPLQLAGPDAGVLLVQRGWAPRNFQQHSRLPPVQTPRDTVVQVVGRVAPAPSRLYEFQGGDGASSRIRQNLGLAAFRAETGLALAHLTVLQTGPASEGLRRDWPAIDTGVDKHYGYAFQWFGLCGLMAVLYVWFQIVRRFIRPPGQPAA
ncbi:SURF1 family protein [Verminephrobacter eiseniae]|uniref:SURF1 family protein n=1 Tax=Verminephrobacter eiseniae TaxID=364317 RepID=UPI002237D9F9|nr:SURF1 family protein [Verminephrobacter eiseniae]MCW5236174.1 SURF1 family protein [Verminephrobacter eiseniae]